MPKYVEHYGWHYKFYKESKNMEIIKTNNGDFCLHGGQVSQMNGDGFSIIRKEEIINIAVINRIVTHKRPDLDACLSVWIIQQAIRDLISRQEDLFQIEVDFAPTGMKKEEMKKYSVYVDMECGYKGSENECASVWLAKRYLSKIEYDALDLMGLWNYVNDVDTGKEIPYNPIGNNIIAAWKLIEFSDNEIILQSDKIFSGLLLLGLKKLQAKEIAKKVSYYTKNGYTIAFISLPEDSELNPAISEYLSEPTICIVTQIGKNIGVKRLNENIDLTKLKLPDGWYKHPSGFMVQWGDLSGKGTKAEKESPLNAEQLIYKILGMLYKYHYEKE